MVKPKKRSLLYNLFIALALFVATPVLIMVSMSDYVLMNTISDEIGKANVGKLKVATSIYQMLDELVQNSCVRISMDAQLNTISAVASYDSLLNDSVMQYEFLRYQNLLGEVVRTNPVFHSIHIILKDVDYVISSNDGTVPRSGFSDADWLAETLLVHATDDHSSYLPPHVPGKVDSIGDHVPNAWDERVISYLYPLMPYITNLRGFVVLNINEREFSRRINSSNYGTEGSIAIVDNTGQVITDVDRTKVGLSVGSEAFFARILKESGQDGFFVMPGKESDHLIAWLRLEADSRIFVGDFNLGVLTHNVGTIRLQTILISLIVVVVGLAFSYLVSWRFFNPVRRLIQEIQQRTGSDSSGEVNEVNLLSTAFEVMIRRENQLFLSLEQHRQNQNDEWVKTMIAGFSLGADILPRPDSLKGQWLMAAYVVIDGYDDFCRRIAHPQREFLRSLVLHMAEEAFLPEMTCVGSLTESQGVVLILATDSEDPGRIADILDTGFAALAAEAQKALQATVSFCVGFRCQEPAALSASWIEAQALLKQRFMQGPGQWYWSENTVADGLTSFYPRRVENRILAAMAAGNKAEARDALQTLIKAIRVRPGMGYDNVMLILNQLVGGIIKQVIELNISVTDLFGADHNFYGTLTRMETLSEAGTWILTVIEAVMAYQCQETESVQNHVNAMIDFIRNNYHHDFGIEAVADHVGLSYSHARKIFQDELGDSIVNYVNTLRIAEAERLLRETNDRLETIAIRIGYNNCQSFNRYFKKFTGQTPGEFRLHQLSAPSNTQA